MSYKEIFVSIRYPKLLDTLDELKIDAIPPWDFINTNNKFWNDNFEEAGLVGYIPFARMRNDDIVAAFNISEEILLFTLPLSTNTMPYRKLDNIESWLKLAMEDSYEYITEY